MVVDLHIDKLVQGGDGLADLDGMKVFVPLAAPQERVRAWVAVRKKDYAVARIQEVLEPSPLRVEPRCPYYGECGGCQLQHIDYQAQLVVKKLFVSETLQRIGKVFVPVRNMVGTAEPWRYRNKTQYPVMTNGGMRAGFFKRNSHRLLDVESCLLHSTDFDRLRSAFLDAATAAGETGYNEESHSGNIRHFVLRRPVPDGGLVAIIVTRTGSLSRRLVDILAGQPGVAGVVQNINPDRTNRITGRRTSVLAGNGELSQIVLGKQLRVSPTSFFQVNIVQTEELCRKVLRFVAPQGNETVIDLYSGVGMLSLIIAGFVKNVVGIEIDPVAVEDARQNARALGATGARFLCGDVDEVITGVERADAVILDPPRKGCRPETLTRVAALKPSRIVYVSCNPPTLARDLAFLERLGYATQDVEPVDMFPQTFHVEVVAFLSPAACPQ